MKITETTPACVSFKSKILELEKDELYRKYKDRVGEVISGEVYQIWKKELMILDEEGNELILPKTEMIPADHYKKGDTIRAVVHKVETQIIFVEVIEVFFLQIRAFDLVGRAIPLSHFHAIGDAAHFKMRDRRAFAGMDVFRMHDDGEPPVEIEDIALAD